MSKIGITGCKGRMGQLLVEEVENADDLEFAGGIDKDDVANELFEKAEGIIDFTTPEATLHHAALAALHKIPLVIGTTGLTEEDEKQLADFSKDTAIIYAANMSIGVNMLMALVKRTAARLGPEWDIEIFDTHHHHKVDSPSGTALALGKAAQDGRGGGEFVTDRTGKRNQGDIGYAVQRGGDVVGEHDVTFFGTGERITLGHKATDRRLFAKGALHAMRWAIGKPAGLYSMQDILDLD
ncbi:MAG: 4-hydroxy-tetrahydrodipicolinate reductase [Pseudomonadota bacterium]